MEDFSREDRGIFQGIKVPFCLNAIILAFMAYVIFVAGSRGLGWAMQDDVAYEKVVYGARDVVASRLPFLGRPLNIFIREYANASYTDMEAAYEIYRDKHFEKQAARQDGRITNPMSFEQFKSPQWWKWLVFGFWFLFIWSIFAGAINRTAAYRIARDESITLKEGLNFGVQTWTNHFLAIVFVAIFVAAAYFMCVFGGFICQIPYVGELLLVLGFIFILVAAFLITLLLAGLVFGFNMISSAIGVDKVDSFDAISRSYSYVLGRPWQALLYTFLPFLFLLFFLAFGKIFLDVALGAIGMGMGGKFTSISEYANLKGSWEVIANLPWTMKVSAVVLKVFIFLTKIFIIATAITYWLSAKTKAYFLLRKEVDGDEVEEMYLDEEEEAFAAGEPEMPAPAETPAAPEVKKEEPAAPAPAKEEPARKEGKKYTEKELGDLPMDDLRAIGQKYDITGRSKKKIIERILKAQEK
jgi:hypothetical protein